MRLRLFWLALAWFCVTSAFAQEAYPLKPVRVVIPFPPGGTLDKVGRMLAQRLGEQWGQSVLIDNRPGGNGVIGIREAIKAQKVVAGMDREQVLLAAGPPRDKVRETKEDVDYEDWIYGKPPVIVRFVKFAGAKVVEVQEFYAGIGGSTADTGPIQ